MKQKPLRSGGVKTIRLVFLYRGIFFLPWYRWPDQGPRINKHEQEWIDKPLNNTILSYATNKQILKAYSFSISLKSLSGRYRSIMPTMMPPKAVQIWFSPKI